MPSYSLVYSSSIYCSTVLNFGMCMFSVITFVDKTVEDLKNIYNNGFIDNYNWMSKWVMVTWFGYTCTGINITDNTVCILTVISQKNEKPKIYKTVRTVLTINKNVVETEAKLIHLSYDCSLSWLGTDTSIKSGSIKQVLCVSLLIVFQQ
jgi:hypothetical protein